MPSSRSIVAITVAVASALTLGGCASAGAKGGSSPAPSASSSASSSASAATDLTCAKDGDASGAVKVSGSAGALPTVSFPTPTAATATERTVVTAGDGAAIQQGDSVRVAYVLYDAKTGKKLDSSGYGSTDPITLTVSTASTLKGIVEALACTHVGERFASVIPAASAFGDTGSKQLGVGGGDSIVFVGDVVGINSTKATGKAKALPEGFPKVALAANGQPTVSIPSTKAPATLRIADSKVGTGETVRTGDTVTLQYQGVLWRTGKVFDQSWGRSGPTALATTGVVPGFGKALVGQKVGSQVVAIVPPADGYGASGTPDGTIKGTDTMVFVVDILATAHAS